MLMARQAHQRTRRVHDKLAHFGEDPKRSQHVKAETDQDAVRSECGGRLVDFS